MEPHPILKDIAFRMMTDHELEQYLTCVCTNQEIGHNYSNCLFVHDVEHPNASALLRRPVWKRTSSSDNTIQYILLYLPDLCQYLNNDRCPYGDACQFAHNIKEQLYHPYHYKQNPCRRGPACTKRFCCFYHSELEREAGLTLKSRCINSEHHSVEKRQHHKSNKIVCDKSVKIELPTLVLPSNEYIRTLSHINTIHSSLINLQTLMAQDFEVSTVVSVPKNPQPLNASAPVFVPSSICSRNSNASVTLRDTSVTLRDTSTTRDVPDNALQSHKNLRSQCETDDHYHYVLEDENVVEAVIKIETCCNELTKRYIELQHICQAVLEHQKTGQRPRDAFFIDESVTMAHSVTSTAEMLLEEANRSGLSQKDNQFKHVLSKVIRLCVDAEHQLMGFEHMDDRRDVCSIVRRGFEILINLLMQHYGIQLNSQWFLGDKLLMLRKCVSVPSIIRSFFELKDLASIGSHITTPDQNPSLRHVLETLTSFNKVLRSVSVLLSEPPKVKLDDPSTCGKLSEKKNKSDHRKTALCRLWSKNGVCPHGSSCLFAHGANELRNE